MSYQTRAVLAAGRPSLALLLRCRRPRSEPILPRQRGGAAVAGRRFGLLPWHWQPRHQPVRQLPFFIPPPAPPSLHSPFPSLLPPPLCMQCGASNSAVLPRPRPPGQRGDDPSALPCRAVCSHPYLATFPVTFHRCECAMLAWHGKHATGCAVKREVKSCRRLKAPLLFFFTSAPVELVGLPDYGSGAISRLKSLGWTEPVSCLGSSLIISVLDIIAG